MRQAWPKQLSAFKIQDGDQIPPFSPIAPYNESAIYLQGHCLRGRAVILIEKG